MPTFAQIMQGINTGLGAYGTIAGSQHGGSGGAGGGCHAPSGCFQCPMSDQGSIAACIDLLAVQLHQMEAQQRAGQISGTDLVTAFEGALAALNNSAYFAQGNDAYLNDAKSVVAHSLQLYRAQFGAGSGGLSSGGGSTSTGSGNSGNTANAVGSVSNELISGVPNIVLIGGAVIGLVFFLRK